MNNPMTASSRQKTDYLVIGAGAMGMAFADEILTNSSTTTLTIVDSRDKPGGHWNNAYPFVRLHQPAAFYGVNSLVLGNGSTDLSSKTEILDYYKEVMTRFIASGRVVFKANHQYIGAGQIRDINNTNDITTYEVKERIVDASYMKVEVPSTHAPKYKVDSGVPLLPINALVQEYKKWDHFYVIGNGKTGMDAVLYLLDKGVQANSIHWITPNQAWIFDRDSLQVGKVAKAILKHAEYLTTASRAEEVFVNVEKTGGILRLDPNVSPVKWRCATVNQVEMKALKSIKNIIKKGRIEHITSSEIILEKGSVSYGPKTLFVDCSANALSAQKETPIFSEGKITLQSVLFCQQVFSAATIAKLELANISDYKRNKVVPVPHPEYTEDWPKSLAVSIDNLLLVHKYFPLWMYRSRLNFMSHESLINYFAFAIKALFLSRGVRKSVARMTQV